MPQIVVALALALTWSLLPAPHAAALTFSPPGPVSTGPAYGDFFSYSMHLENCLHTNPCDSNINNANDPFYVQASTGQTTNLAVIYQHPAETNSPGKAGPPSPFPNGVADDSYDTPSGKATSFSTTGSDPTSGPAAGDGNSWDVTLTALQTYLAGHDLVYLVASNQVGGEADLLAWGRVTLIDTDPSNGTLTPICFDLNNTRGDPLAYGPITGAACTVAPTEPSGSSTGDFLTVLGRFCLDGTTGAVIDCASANPNKIGPFDSNVGNNEFDFALFSPELNNLQAWINMGYTVAQHWFELRNLSDGDETVVICNFCDIPSPQTLALLVSGALSALVARGAWRRRATA